MADDIKSFRRKLKKFGLSDPAITAAWPDWWSDDAYDSPSARNELKFSLSRKLGLDPQSLLKEDGPQFIWKDEAKFKHFTGENDFEKSALSSFGIAIARTIISATPLTETSSNISAQNIRNSILSHKPFVGLIDLLGLCWGLGIPVIQLRVFPLAAKRMCAMAVKAGDRYAILIGRDSEYPAQIAYYVAHELGHIFLGHLRNNIAVVEFDDILKTLKAENDPEERDADRFALEVLTGNPEPSVVPSGTSFIARDLAATAVQTSAELRVEPGTLALCLGHATGRWDKIFAAMNLIYTLREPLWQTINTVALQQMNFASVSSEFSSYIHAVMEVPRHD